MKAFVLIFSVVSSMAVSAAAETRFRCSVGQLGSWRGARVNMIYSESNGLRANLVFGTTVSGTMYRITSQEDGVYLGEIKKFPKAYLKLRVSNTKAENKYIKGTAASLEVVYPDLNSRSGLSKLKTETADNFVCGVKSGNYSEEAAE